MKPVFITNNYKPAVAYTDYCILYRKFNGSMFRSLGLLAFCRKINTGFSVRVGDVIFTADIDYQN